MALQVGRAASAAASGRIPLVLTPVAGVPLVLWVALASGLLSYAGAVWDVSWHRTIGRDTFWAPPHLALYAGILIRFGAAFWALAMVVRAPRLAAGATWRLGPLCLPVGYGLAFLGGLVVLLSAPVDDYWHVTYGRDVDIWSPPHLLAVAGSALGTIGWTLAILPWLPVPGVRGRPTAGEGLYWVGLGLLLYTGWFGLNWYHMVAATRDALQYPALVGLVLLPALVAASRYGRGWPAVMGAVAFAVLALLPLPVFAAIGWRLPALPPLLVVPALAVELLRRRLEGRWPAAAQILALGVAFPLLLLAVEVIQLQLVPLPALPASGLEALVARPYVAVAAARPWTLASLVAALPLVLAASVVGAALGWLLGSAFRAAAGSNSRPGAAALKEQGEERIIWAEAGLGPPESLDQPTPAEQESERSATGRAR